MHKSKWWLYAWNFDYFGYFPTSSVSACFINHYADSRLPTPSIKNNLGIFFHWQPYFLGTKVASFVSGPKAPRRGSVYDGLMHISDWYPTILSAAGLKTPRGLNLDGHNQWPAIKGRRQESPRKVDLKIKSPITTKTTQKLT